MKIVIPFAPAIDHTRCIVPALDACTAGGCGGTSKNRKERQRGFVWKRKLLEYGFAFEATNTAPAHVTSRQPVLPNTPIQLTSRSYRSKKEESHNKN